jgi:Zn-dependent peptidase ImmA (M78 family)
LLLHSRKATFVDVQRGPGSGDPEEEEEANAWASDFLIPQAALTAFIQRFGFTEAEVIDFAREHQVAPGIVVGQLQHRKVLKFSHMRRLREIYDDCEISAICASQKETRT